MVKLDKYFGSFNSSIDLSNKICIPNKTEDLNLSAFNMITNVNKSKTLPKHLSWECKCRFDGRLKTKTEDKTEDKSMVE